MYIKRHLEQKIIDASRYYPVILELSDLVFVTFTNLMRYNGEHRSKKMQGGRTFS